MPATALMARGKVHQFRSLGLLMDFARLGQPRFGNTTLWAPRVQAAHMDHNPSKRRNICAAQQEALSCPRKHQPVGHPPPENHT